MAKHFEEKENKKSKPIDQNNKKNEKNKSIEKNKKKTAIWIIISSIIIILAIAGTLLFLNYGHIKNNNEDMTTTGEMQNQKVLELKSLSEPNKTIKYKFEEDLLKTVETKEQFEDEQQFEMKRRNYEENLNINIVKIDEKNKILITQKKDLGTDNNLSYEQIYDKYLIQMIGRYEQIQ